MTIKQIDPVQEKRKNRILADLDYTSTQLSTQSRYIAFVIIGSFFSILISADNKSNIYHIYMSNKSLFNFSVFFASLSILFDFLQYVFGYLSSDKAYKTKDMMYIKKWFVYICRNIFFFVKISAIFINSIFYIIIFYKLLTN